MKPTRLIIHNIGIISDIDVDFKKSMYVFYGGVRQGKTSILNSFRWACGGKYPKDILKHGTEDGFIHLFLEDGSSVRREFYLSKTSGVKDRPVQYIKDMSIQSKPVEKLQALFNPFQLNQNHFTDMSALDKKRFLIDLFKVDTAKETKELKEIKTKGLDLNKSVNALTFKEEVKAVAVDVDDLNKQLSGIETFNEQQEDLNEILVDLKIDESEIENDIHNLKKDLETKEKSLLLILKNIKGAKKPKKPKPSKTIEEKISDAKLINYKASQYAEALQHNKDQKTKETNLKKKVSEARAEYKSKEKEIASKLQDINKSHGIKGLVFQESGDFTYDGTSAEMLSTSQNAKLSSQLQSKYPGTISVELVDQGESWGTTIMDLIAKAKKENKVILTTVVGEKPAKTSKDVGVYVVKNGTIHE